MKQIKRIEETLIKDHELYVIYENLNDIIFQLTKKLIDKCSPETITYDIRDYDKIKGIILNQLHISMFVDHSVNDFIINVMTRIIMFHYLPNGNKRAAVIIGDLLAKHLCYQILWCKINVDDFIVAATLPDIDFIVINIKKAITFIPLSSEHLIHAHKEDTYLNKIIKKLELN